MFLKKGIKVKVLTGKDKGKDGEIIQIDRSRDFAKVKSLNMVKKHKKPTKENKGGIVSKEAYIHLSNLKKIEDIKKLSKDQSIREITKLKKDLFNIRFKKINGQLQNTAEFLKIRKNIARLYSNLGNKK